MRRAGGKAERYHACAWLTRVGLVARAGDPAGELSHGEKRSLEIAMALALHPRLMLLDEPFAGLGFEETRAGIGSLRALKSEYTILLVEHDMDAVFALADEIGVSGQRSPYRLGDP